MNAFVSKSKTLLRDGRFLVIPMLLFSLLSGLLLYFTFASYVKFAATEILAGWLASEAGNIQEGNLLEALAKNRRIIVSSNIIRGVALVQDRGAAVPEVQMLFGQVPSVFPTRPGPPAVKTMVFTSTGFLEGKLQYRFAEVPSYYIEVSVLPVFLINSFFLIFLLYLLSFIALFGLVARASSRERSRRVDIIRVAIDDLISRDIPGEFIANSLPNLGKSWAEMKTKLNKLQEEMLSKARMVAIAEATAHISHDLRTPLTSFEALLAVPDGEMMGRHKDLIRSSLNKLQAMIESLRHLDAEHLVSVKASTLQLEESLAILRGKAERRGLRLSYKQDLPAGPLFIDAPKVERAWMNLVSNAIEAARTAVDVEITSEGHALRLRVVDNGPGVPPALLPRLFQRGATMGKSEGTGLGLAYAQQVIKGHGGELRYRREGERSIFEGTLPHALELKPERIEVEASLEIKKALPQRIAICLEPPELNVAVLNELQSLATPPYIFEATLSATSDGLVTNQEPLVSRALEAGIELIEIRKSLNAAQICERLLRRWQLVREPSYAEV